MYLHLDICIPLICVRILQISGDGMCKLNLNVSQEDQDVPASQESFSFTMGQGTKQFYGSFY